MHKLISLFLLPILLVIGTIGCGDRASSGKQTKTPGYPIQIVATVGMVADLAREVGGEHVEVSQICGTGVDPHLYKASRDDVAALSRADMVFYSGLMLEGKMTDVLIKMARKRPVIAVTEVVDEAVLLEPEDMAGHYDPHLWMDVSAWSKCAEAVANSLAEYDPDNAESYSENASKLIDQLESLHEYGKQAIGSIPEGSRVLVTSHDAFNYLGRAYGLEVQGVQGISTESEAGLQRVSALVDLLVQKNVKAVFVESSVPRKSIDSLIEGCRSRGHEVVVGGELFSDAMGEEGTYEGTYIGMLDHNITTIAQALGGSVPQRGLNQKLTEHE